MATYRPPKLLVLGIDGGDPNLLRRFFSKNLLPNLSEIADKGTFCPLQSTLPPTTFPAWTNFMTGTTPDMHGITDFTQKKGYNVEFIGGHSRRTRTFFEHMNDNGVTVGTAWFPATYPPLPLHGYQISGWDSPVTDRGDATFVHPPELHNQLVAQFPKAHLRFNTIDEFADHTNWYRNAKRRLLQSVDERARMALWLLDNKPVDVAAFYFGETDTVAHHFYAFGDPTSPRRPPNVDPELETAILDVYKKVDIAVGKICQHVGNIPIVIVSDHGVMGNSDTTIYLNRFLESKGLLSFKKRNLSKNNSASRNHVRFIPSAWRRSIFQSFGGIFPSMYESRLRFSGIDFPKTQAFSEEIPYAPSIWLNQLGRDPKGTVKFRQRSKVIAAIEKALRCFKYSDESPVVKKIHRREELHTKNLHLFPDIILELNSIKGYMPVCSSSNGQLGPTISTMSDNELLGRKGTSMPGGHAPQGIFLSNMAFHQYKTETLHLHHIANMLYEIVDIWPPEQFEMNLNPTKAVSNQRRRPYTLKEQQVVAIRLKRLGYLEN